MHLLSSCYLHRNMVSSMQGHPSAGCRDLQHVAAAHTTRDKTGGPWPFYRNDKEIAGVPI